MATNEQVNGHGLIDGDGLHLESGVWVPASAVLGVRALYGVEEQGDSGNPQTRYTVLPVAEHLPLTPVGAHTFYNAGTSGTQQIGMGVPGAGVIQVVRGFAVSGMNATGAQQLTFSLTGITEPLMNWYLELGTGTCPLLYVPFPAPIQATAANVQIILKTIFPAASLGRIDLALWGYNRAV